MSREQHWRAVDFAERALTAKAEVVLAYAGGGHWTASSNGAAGDLRLPAPAGEAWPSLESLLRILAGVGIFRAKVGFRGMPPAFASDSSGLLPNGLEQYGKVMAFSEKVRSCAVPVELELGADGLWRASFASKESRHRLEPVCGDGWGRIEGLLQALAGGGLSEARVTFVGMPPRTFGAGMP